MSPGLFPRSSGSYFRVIKVILLSISVSTVVFIINRNKSIHDARCKLIGIRDGAFCRSTPRLDSNSRVVNSLALTHSTARDYTGKNVIAPSSAPVGKKLTPDTNGSASGKLILFWNKLETFSFYGFQGDEFQFREICGTDRCRTTYRKSLFQEADAVIFTIKDVLSWKGFPKEKFIKRSDVAGYPKHSNVNQIFVLFHIEAPARFRRLPWHRFNRIFNLTYSYLRHPDTDIQVEYGRIIPRPVNNPHITTNGSILTNKTRLVAWAVSNCFPSNVRNEYVRELRKHIPVDVYGACGDLSLNCAFKEEGCFDGIAKRYFFFLAFENSHCKDYVTEKLYRTLTMDLVPVVMGGADYRKLLPPRSYIDAKDFKSPRSLAEYLLKLSNDTDGYLSYFRWKEGLMADNVHDAAYNLGLCKLCDILHDPDYVYKPPCFDYKSYYSAEKYCLPVSRQKRLFGLR